MPQNNDALGGINRPDTDSPNTSESIQPREGGWNQEGLPTGEGTSAEDEVADPHPATEEDYDKIPHPGGVAPWPHPDIGPNSYANDGTAPPRPKNVESEE